MKQKSVRWVAIFLVAAFLVAACGGDSNDNGDNDDSSGPTNTPTDDQRLVLATGTTAEDSGLLAAILPAFEDEFDAMVDVVSVGTGQALELGASGDADVVLTHARELEEAFVAGGDGLRRLDVMTNTFIIVGPPDDPADVQAATDILDALERIAATEATFIARGDQSGTAIREEALWSQTSLGRVPDADWYQAAGQGMGAVLTIAAESEAYTLSDQGTFLARQAEGVALEALYGDPEEERLQNPYSVIPINPEQHPNVNAELAQDFTVWLTSIETQQAIADFRVNDTQLFFPNSAVWQARESATENVELD